MKTYLAICSSLVVAAAFQTGCTCCFLFKPGRRRRWSLSTVSCQAARGLRPVNAASPVKGAGILGGWNLVRERSARVCRGHNHLRQAAEIVDELLRDVHLLAAALGEIPAVQHQLDRKDASCERRRHVFAAGAGNHAFEVDAPPGVDRLCGHDRDEVHQRTFVGVLHLGSRHRPELDQRPEQVLHHLVTAELRARRWFRTVLGGEVPQDGLYHRDRRVRRTDRWRGSRGPGPTCAGRLRRWRPASSGDRSSGPSPRRAWRSAPVLVTGRPRRVLQ